MSHLRTAFDSIGPATHRLVRFCSLRRDLSRGRGRVAREWLIERLEGRILPGTIAVTNLHNGGHGSLRAAIVRANREPGRDTIKFAHYLKGTIKLSTALPELATNMVIVGPGRSAVTVALGHLIEPPPPREIPNLPIVIMAHVKVRISGLTLSSGPIVNEGTLTLVNSVVSGSLVGGVFNDAGANLTITHSTISNNDSAPYGEGAGIQNAGELTINNSTITHNASFAIGGTIFNDNTGTLTITNSTISDNIGGIGAGIVGSGTMTITNSTISDNVGSFSAGGISADGSVAITNSTISGNINGGVFSSGSLWISDSTISGNASSFKGAGIESTGSLVLNGTIVAGNTAIGHLAMGDVSGAVAPSSSHNLIGDGTGLTGIANGGTGNLIGTASAPIDARLGPLADNGGPTFTEALLAGSPAIDGGVSIPGLTTDQRGFPRRHGSAPDIGAFEVQS
jgi:hypothetical protein